MRETGRHAGAQLAYRPDIDGLRAIAVLPILFNHVGVRGFGGGYVGVDIFFVISGYLITGILARDIAAGRHSIRHFYVRRVLRIFPALMATLLAVTIIASATLLPGELMRYARSLAGTAIFASNFVFYGEAGYFDSASHTKPLLHTWSLAIEEQFYLLWPLLLAAIGAGRQRAMRWAIALLTFASLAIAILTIRTDMSAAFYLLPSRAWELGLGGLLAVWPRPRVPRLLRETTGAIALIAIMLCCWRYSNLTPFPGLAALPPCLAAAALIASGPETLAARLLGSAPLRFVGQISFSLYLWHWPIVTFAKTWWLLPDTAIVMAGEILLSLLLATVSWRIVETPVRIAGRSWSTGRVLTSAAAAMLVTLGCAGAIFAARGLPARFTVTEAALARFNDGDYQASYRRGTCFLDEPLQTLAPSCVTRAIDARPHLLLVGDSMAADLWPGLARHLDRYDVMQATRIGCTPGFYGPSPKPGCERFFHDMLDGIAQSRPGTTLVLSGRWKPSDMAEIEATLVALKRRRVATIVLGPMPSYDAALPRLLVLAERARDPQGFVASFLHRDAFAIDRTMRMLAARYDAAYVSPLSVLCASGRCRTLAAPGVPLQFDDTHMTPAGSAVVVDALLPAIATAIAPDAR
jgi:peptidoglycan/LPS O-acetylase OafA/YrhL